MEMLQREGYATPNEEIMSMLKEYWNLKLEFALPDGQFSDLELNVETAMSNFDEDAAKIFGRIVGEELIPIAAMHCRTALALVSQKLHFYMIAEGDIYLIAHAFVEFLDVIINRKQILKYSY